MTTQTNVTFFHKGDQDKRGSILITLPKTEAKKYLAQWVRDHSTTMYPYKKQSDGSYQSKFTRIYLEAA